MSESYASPDSSTTDARSLCQLNAEPQSVIDMEKAPHAHSEAIRRVSDMDTGVIYNTGACTDRSRHGKQQSFKHMRGTIGDKQNGKSESMATDISVHLDDNADGYYCCGCGIRRSDEHHRVRKFKSGDPAWRNFCRRCHAKHLVNSRGKTMKTYANFCFGCGFARSSQFNKEHPINQDQRPVKNFCAYCMKKVSRKALIPTETLLGSSSDESDSELDRQQINEDGDDRWNIGQGTHFLVSHHRSITVLNIDAANNNEPPGDTSAENSPSESVIERLRKRRSGRISHATPSEEDQCGTEWSTVNRHEDNDEASPATCIKHGTSAVDDDLKKSCNQSANCDMTSGTYKPSPVSCPHAKRFPDAPSTPEASMAGRDSILEAGSSLLSSDSKLPSKRATFNERVEVRTSPTYWQREHSEGDGPYAQFRHENYHEELREGQKAVPLKDPLKDPDGNSAGQLHLPRYSVDEESFNSWSAPSAGCDAFAASGCGYSFSSNRPGDNQQHLNTLCPSQGYSRVCNSGLDVGPSDFDETRPNLSNRQYQPYSDNNFPCNQGKENQSCPTNPVAPEGSYPPLSSFGEHCCSGTDCQCNWSSRHDGPCASHVDLPWCLEDPYSNLASSPTRNCKYPGFTNSFSRDYDIDHDGGLNASFPSKDQEAIPDDRGFHQGSSDSDSARQRFSQPRHSHPSDRQWTCHDTEPFSIHKDFLESRPRFPRRFSGCSADQRPDIEHDFPNDIPYDADTNFDFSSASKSILHEPRLPSTGCAMEIPDDMSDSDVHNLLIPGYDNYVPWRKTGST
ncbi:uncharacterized protein LY79DRAFT_656188 [Colletotrichum navitas]|uniref:Uncharacterized protein n=1 Tax=Colletotrichum navitas TaxID=681940 RepID=A0AAD8QBD6_9PEZI|nr:uncharacterized protein LY79DRAFT_656188 [Colletotrichum navitas]KAK1597884.1 hypothetical protein LY79DRAFT_656188 [Colletotrichum navitas]